MNHIETLPENHEVIYPNSNLIDSEPFYGNFTTIQNELARQEVGHLIGIVEEIGYKSRSNITKEHFQRSYQKKYSCSASMIHSPTTPISDENQSFSRSKIMSEQDVLRWYGLGDDDETVSTVSSQGSSISSPEPNEEITVQEYYGNHERPCLIVNGSISSSEQSLSDDEYELILQKHPDVYQDPNPEVINRSNPDPMTYQQNVSVRYLVPPTPPPHGPLIIREILPPRAPTPPPLVISQQDPRSSTPPPLILRERPPTPPSQQETEIITKTLPQEPTPARRVVIEHTPQLPPKPQSIIIEKWLPYKPPPPREIIYERVTEDTRIPIPVHIEHDNSSLFEQFAWSTQQHLHRLQAQHRDFYGQFSTHHLTTPALIINYPPVTRTTTTLSSFFHNEQIIYPNYM